MISILDGIVDVATFVVMCNGMKIVIIYGLHDDFVVFKKLFLLIWLLVFHCSCFQRKQCWCCFHVSKEKRCVLVPNLHMGGSRFVIDSEVDFWNNLI
jgi:hypothetical protein